MATASTCLEWSNRESIYVYGSKYIDVSAVLTIGNLQIEFDKKQKELDVRPKRQQNKKSEGYLPLDCYKQARIAL